MIKVYGIKNCDKVRNILKELQNNKTIFEFIDYRQNPINNHILNNWIMQVGIDKLINKRSTTYRNLSEININNQIILDNITLIKRPIIIKNEIIIQIGNEVI